jgi:hypothetical protein
LCVVDFLRQLGYVSNRQFQTEYYSTYVNGTVTTDESEDTAHDTNAEREAL